MSSINYNDFCQNLPENIRSDKQLVMKLCRAAGVKVPLVNRFYTKQHVVRSNNVEKEATFVVVPGNGKYNLWVKNSEYADFANAVIEFGKQNGLI